MQKQKPTQPNSLDVALGFHIRQRRKALGMSQTELAEAVGITFQQVQKYERGFNRVSFSRLVDICQALDCRITDLTRDLDDRSQPSPALLLDTQQLQQGAAVELLSKYSALRPSLRRLILELVRKLPSEKPIAAPDKNGPIPDAPASDPPPIEQRAGTARPAR